ALQGKTRRGLLGFLLAAAGADAQLVPCDGSPDLEAPVVRGACLAGDRVVDGFAVTRESLLKLRLEVHPLAGGLRDFLIECINDPLRGALEAMAHVAGADHGLTDRGQSALRGQQRVDR